jgi:3-hydroxybutyryl-CoA dehydrogenase
MRYSIVQQGESRSFPPGDKFLAGAAPDADVVVYLGAPLVPDAAQRAIGESAGTEGSNVVGFARYRNGDDPPSPLVELVRQPATRADAIEAGQKLFEAAGLKVVVCSDQAGRIIDRLVRPKYNAALRFLDEGLAAAKDIDLTCRLGLGYPDGPVERVERGGLVHHHDVTRALFETYGTPAYAPARRAVVAKMRSTR